MIYETSERIEKTAQSIGVGTARLAYDALSALVQLNEAAFNAARDGACDIEPRRKLRRARNEKGRNGWHAPFDAFNEMAEVLNT